jgi:hypothetical protein
MIDGNLVTAAQYSALARSGGAARLGNARTSISGWAKLTMQGQACRAAAHAGLLLQSAQRARTHAEQGAEASPRSSRSTNSTPVWDVAPVLVGMKGDEQPTFLCNLQEMVDGINEELDGRAEINVRDPMSDKDTESLLGDAGLASEDLTDGFGRSEATQLANTIVGSEDEYGESTIYMFGVGGSGFPNAQGAGGFGHMAGRIAAVGAAASQGLMMHELLHSFGVGHMRGTVMHGGGPIPAEFLDEPTLPDHPWVVNEIIGGPACQVTEGCVGDWDQLDCEGHDSP